MTSGVMGFAMIHEVGPDAPPRRARGEHDLPRVSRWLAAIFFPIHAAFMRCYFRVEVGEPIPVARFAGLPSKEGVAALTAALQGALGDVLNRATSVESRLELN